VNCGSMELEVHAIGLVLMLARDKKTTRHRSCQSGPIARMAWEMPISSIKYCIFASSATLLLCFPSLVVMEIYSKRGSLGYPAPIFIATWYIIALVSGIIHSAFSISRRRRYERKEPRLPDYLRSLSAHDDSLAGETYDNASS
jgi:hypothetical protein